MAVPQAPTTTTDRPAQHDDRPERDVPYEAWNDPPVDALPPDWVGQAFLAYSWSARAGS